MEAEKMGEDKRVKEGLNLFFGGLVRARDAIGNGSLWGLIHYVYLMGVAEEKIRGALGPREWYEFKNRVEEGLKELVEMAEGKWGP